MVDETVSGQRQDTGAVTGPAEAEQELDRNGYVVIARRMDDKDLAAARDELSMLVATVGWGSGFDGRPGQAVPVEIPAGQHPRQWLTDARHSRGL
jgi:hypothetical protein